jgi:hypothetical protein
VESNEYHEACDTIGIELGDLGGGSGFWSMRFSPPFRRWEKLQRHGVSASHGLNAPRMCPSANNILYDVCMYNIE